MSSHRYTPEFKDEAVRQVVDRGYSVHSCACNDPDVITTRAANSKKSRLLKLFFTASPW
jgi:hypothetical protein